MPHAFYCAKVYFSFGIPFVLNGIPYVLCLSSTNCKYTYPDDGGYKTFSCKPHEKCCDDKCCANFFKWWPLIIAILILIGIIISIYFIYRRCKKQRPRGVMSLPPGAAAAYYTAPQRPPPPPYTRSMPVSVVSDPRCPTPNPTEDSRTTNSNEIQANKLNPINQPKSFKVTG